MGFPSSGAPYRDAGEQLFEQLERVRVLLAHQLEVRRAMAAGAGEGAARAVERFVVENVEPARVPWTPRVAEALAAIETHVAGRLAATAPAERRLARVVERLGLDGVAVDLLLAAVAPQVSRGFREAMQLLGPEAAPGVHRAAHLVELVAGAPERADAAAAALDDGAPLLASGALRVVAAGAGPLWRAVAPSPYLVRWLRGGGPPSPPLADAGAWSSADAASQQDDAALQQTDPLAERLRALAASAAATARPLRLFLVGEPGSGKSRGARRLAAHLGRGVLELEPAAWRPERADDLLALLLDAELRGQLVYVHARDAAPSEPLLAALGRAAAPVVVSLHGADDALGGWAALPLAGFVRVAVEPPGAQAQLAAWRAAVGDALPEAALTDLVHRHALDFRGIERAAAETRAAVAHGADPSERHAVAVAAARAQVRHRLRDVADRIVTTLTWEDLVLPSEVRE